MNSNALPFMPFAYSAADVPAQEGSDRMGFVLRVPEGLQSKSQLLEALAANGRFPAYFGGNRDSPLDCLKDFHWIEHSEIEVVHTDLPLINHPPECRVYLEVMRDAVRDWLPSHDREAKTAQPDHTLRVIFPTALQSRISERLAPSQPPEGIPRPPSPFA